MMLPMLLLISVVAFSPAQTTSGDLTLSIADVPPVSALDEAIPVNVALRNDGRATIQGEVRLEVIDTWRVDGEGTQPVQIDPETTSELTFQCVPGSGTYAAHYPIHATATLMTPDGERTLRTVLVVEVAREAVSSAREMATEVTRLELTSPGVVELCSLKQAQISFVVGEVEKRQPAGWTGADDETGTSVHMTAVERGDRRRAIGVHPPWRIGWGVAQIAYQLSLPETEPLLLSFATAIRDHVPDREPPSDGVLFEVWVKPSGTADGERIFERFSDAKRWEDAAVDITKFAGQQVELILATHPGPEKNTTCDQAYWAEPVLVAGSQKDDAETPEQRAGRRQQSIELAKEAASGNSGTLAWPLGTDCGIAVVPGPLGIVDAMVSIATNEETATFEGFRVEIGNRRLGDWRSGLRLGETVHDAGVYRLPIQDAEREYALITHLWNEEAGLRASFALDGIVPDDQGHPRITHISLGPVDQPVHRLYAGHGNVLEEPGKLRIGYSGFGLSTSFAGFDFANGVSLVQATNIPPDAVTVDPEQGLATLEAHHPLTFTLVPSADGAFGAARKYRQIAQPEASPSISKLLGRMCLDQWGGDYRQAGLDLERAAQYGLTDSVFVKHVWQRWGYDYRLPDIFPPAGSWSDFEQMADACKRHGILFAPHDNYIDFYPDAPGFSYRHILFNPDGTPQRAWYNKGRQAQSYRWLPHAFQTWMESNLQQIRDSIAPTSYFIDVFSAIGPMDYHDEAGNFYPKTATVERWGSAFDEVRETFDGAPTISEAGHDALMGHLDAAQADHQGWSPEAERWTWGAPASDGERIPWHDMVSHGKFILFAGGLGSRYAAGGHANMHGYGSDDYLSMTVLGGRNPMCDGPFSRRTVMTYWLLHDICAELSKRELTRHTFVDDNIHQQMTWFGEDARVLVNRSHTEMELGDETVPRYGFTAKAGDYRANILRREGVITAFAESPESLFLDARPPEHFGGLPLHVEILGVEALGDRRFALLSRWVVQSPIADKGRPFLHFVNAEVAPESENIAFQGGFSIGPEQWEQLGIYEVRAEVQLPEEMPAGEYGVRYGIYQPERGGKRLPIPGARDATQRRIGGTIVVTEADSNGLTFEYRPPEPDEATERLNLARQLIDFGPIMTNGAFRLLKMDRLVIPLPDSADFEVIFNLDKLGYPAIQRVEALDEQHQIIKEMEIHTQEELLHFTGEQGIFAYRLVE